MSRGSYMSQLKPKDRDFLLKLAYSDDEPAASVRKPVETVSSDRENRSTNLIDRLKSELTEERGEVFRLRSHCEALEDALQESKKSSELLLKEQEDRIAVISERFKEVMTENLKLKKQITFSLKQYEEHNAEASSATEALSTLRQLLLSLIEKENARKKRDISEKRLWESLGILIPESEPPVDFPVTLRETENGKVTVEARKRDEVINTLRSRIEQLEKENAELISQKRDYKRASETEFEKTKRQLVGSIRRIQYLVQEKDQLTTEKRQIQEYCSKLEAKLLTFTSAKKTTKSFISEESQRVDLRVDKQKLLELVESESSEVSEEVLRRVQEASWAKGSNSHSGD